MSRKRKRRESPKMVMRWTEVTPDQVKGMVISQFGPPKMMVEPSFVDVAMLGGSKKMTNIDGAEIWNVSGDPPVNHAVLAQNWQHVADNKADLAAQAKDGDIDQAIFYQGAMVMFMLFNECVKRDVRSGRPQLVAMLDELRAHFGSRNDSKSEGDHGDDQQSGQAETG